MITINGYYFDGSSSKKSPVTIQIELSGDISINGDHLTLNTHIEQVKISPRLGNTRRNIFLANGAKLETDDNEALDRVCHYFAKNTGFQLIHRLEKSWPIVLISFLVTAAFLWGAIEFAVPVTAKWVARSVPQSVEQNMGEQGLETLDKWLFSSSNIDQQIQSTLQTHFKQLTSSTEQKYPLRLLFRSSQQMGANALALPGGIIIVTDGLVELAENEQQIMAVIAHEIGHINKQHGLRSILQDSMTALFMAGLLGDITSLSSLSVTLPTILVESHFSREFELEADRFAVKTLTHLNTEVDQLVTILSLLEQQHPEISAYKFNYLSSHPALAQRIEAIRTSKLRQNDYYNGSE